MGKRRYYVIGAFTPETEDAPAQIVRGGTEQGYVFKDERAFMLHKNKVCYIPELSDAEYTRQNFLDMCNGQAEFAAIVFEAVDWQHPETYVEEQFVHGEWDTCPECGRWYDRHASPPNPCGKCGAKLDYEPCGYNCLHCGEWFSTVPSKDELGWHVSCPHCTGSFDVDMEDGK
jgi:DNA-directed RNA polymerase subunit RPC12/RpoP